MHYLHEVSYTGARCPDLQLRVWGLRYPTDLRGDVAQIIFLLWATISSFTKWGGETGSKIPPREKGKQQQNRHKVVEMQRMNGMSIIGCCVPEGSSAEALNQV